MKRNAQIIGLSYCYLGPRNKRTSCNISGNLVLGLLLCNTKIKFNLVRIGSLYNSMFLKDDMFIVSFVDYVY